MLLEEDGADAAARLIRDDRCRVSVVSVAEIVDVGLRGKIDASAVSNFMDELDEVVETVPVDGRVARRAGELRARWYHRKNMSLSLADCVVVATVRPGDRVATSDRALARMARREGLEVIALPGARGRRPR